MLLRTLALATILLFGSTAASVSAADHSNDPKAFEIQKAKDKDKDKNKQSAPVSVPDGDPSTGLLLIIALASAAVCAFARARWQQRVNPEG
jgi:hypothetical protein